jgi:hypothetical protein
VTPCSPVDIYRYSRTSSDVYQTTRRHISGDDILQNHRCENFRSQRVILLSAYMQLYESWLFVFLHRSRHRKEQYLLFKKLISKSWECLKAVSKKLELSSTNFEETGKISKQSLLHRMKIKIRPLNS